MITEILSFRSLKIFINNKKKKKRNFFFALYFFLIKVQCLVLVRQKFNYGKINTFKK